MVQEDPTKALGTPTEIQEYKAKFFLEWVWSFIEVDSASSALKSKVRAARGKLGGATASPTRVLHEAVVAYRQTHETSRGWTAELHAIPKQGPNEAPGVYFKRWQGVLDEHGVVEVGSAIIELFKEGSQGELGRTLMSHTLLKDITWAECGIIAGKVRAISDGRGRRAAYEDTDDGWTVSEDGREWLHRGHVTGLWVRGNESASQAQDGHWEYGDQPYGDGDSPVGGAHEGAFSAEEVGTQD